MPTTRAPKPSSTKIRRVTVTAGRTTPAIGRWGNSLAVRIPAEMANALDLANGTPVRLTVRGHQLVVEPTHPQRRPRPGRKPLAWYIERMTPKTIHESIGNDPIGKELL